MQNVNNIALAYATNALWQLPLLFLAVEITVRLLRRAHGKALHRLWFACMVLALIVPALPLVHIPANFSGAQSVHPLRAGVGVLHLPFVVQEAAKPASPVSAIPVALTTAALWLYWGTVLFALGRLLWALKKTHDLMRSAQEAQPSQTMQDTWDSCKTLLGDRTAKLMASEALNAPATLSWPRPIVLLPLAYEAEDPMEMKAVFCHELAHIQRKDFLWNLVIEFFGIVLFYHPAFHWMRRRLQETRELACDDMAAAAMSGRPAYARHLLQFTEKMLSVAAAPKPDCALGIFEGEVLERRIMKLLETGSKHTPLRVFTSLALGLAVVVTTCVLSADYGLKLVKAQPAAAATQPPPGWFLAGSKPENYQTGVDGAAIQNGRPSAFLKSTVPVTEGFGTLAQEIGVSEYAGKRIRLRASVRAQDVAEWSGLWMRIDKEKEVVAFDNMHNRAIRGTQDWESYDVVLDVPPDATAVVFGVLLSGSGEVWMNDASLEVVGNDVPVTSLPPASPSPLPSQPKNLKFTE